MLGGTSTQELYKFIDVGGLGQMRYTITVEHDSGRIAWKSVLVNGIDGKEAGDIEPLRWYNFLKRRRAKRAVIEEEGSALLLDEEGNYRIYFGG